MIIGYARVSTDDQNLDAQTDALTAAGAERIFSDKISGSMRKRPELDKLLEQLRPGDVIVVTKYDRLARSLRDLLDIVEAIKDQGAGFRSLAEDIDTTTPAGRLVFHVFASIAQFDRERISERTREGLQAAKARGRVGGRLLGLTTAQKTEVRRMSRVMPGFLPAVVDCGPLSAKLAEQVILLRNLIPWTFDFCQNGTEWKMV
jgi:DNA invertase Pin-like site-specific DNA recombinase